VKVPIKGAGGDTGFVRDHRDGDARGIARLQQSCGCDDDVVARDADRVGAGRRKLAFVIDAAEVVPTRA
jgi:hypothetical protein